MNFPEAEPGDDAGHLGGDAVVAEVAYGTFMGVVEFSVIFKSPCLIESAT